MIRSPNMQIRGEYLVRDKDGRPKFDAPHELSAERRALHRRSEHNPSGLSDEEYRAVFFIDGKEIFS